MQIHLTLFLTALLDGEDIQFRKLLARRLLACSQSFLLGRLIPRPVLYLLAYFARLESGR